MTFNNKNKQCTYAFHIGKRYVFLYHTSVGFTVRHVWPLCIFVFVLLYFVFGVTTTKDARLGRNLCLGQTTLCQPMRVRKMTHRSAAVGAGAADASGAVAEPFVDADHSGSVGPSFALREVRKISEIDEQAARYVTEGI